MVYCRWRVSQLESHNLKWLVFQVCWVCVFLGSCKKVVFLGVDVGRGMCAFACRSFVVVWDHPGMIVFLCVGGVCCFVGFLCRNWCCRVVCVLLGGSLFLGQITIAPPLSAGLMMLSVKCSSSVSAFCSLVLRLVVEESNYSPDFNFTLRNNVKISEHAPILTYSNHA